VNKIGSYLSIALIVFIGFFVYHIYSSFIQTEKIINTPLKLEKNDYARIIIRNNTIQATTEKSSAIKQTNPRAKKKEIIIKKDSKIEIKESDFDLFPLDLHASLQIPRLEPTIGMRLIRFRQFGASANINLKGLSLSVERDLYDIFPVLQNTYVGVFYRANYDGYTNYGLQIGVYL